MSIKRRVWEPTSDERALKALAGDTTYADFRKDRQERARELLEWCAIDGNKTGFEIGSGEGTVASLLSPSCLSLDCSDISESFLAKARVTCGSCANVRFFQIESNSLDHLASDHYEFGYSLNVFIHFNPYDIFNYLHSVRRVLKPQGKFYFDACTIGPQTIAIFKDHAGAYRQAPQNLRGLLNFNDPNVLRTVIAKSGLALSNRSVFSDGGWLKILVTRD